MNLLHGLLQIIFYSSPIVVYLVVASMLLLESSAVPIVNTTLLLAAGALASLGHVDIWVLMVAAILGSVSGACLAYGIGLRGGRAICVRLASLFRIDAKKVEMTERWFQRNGMWMVFFSRVTPYVRPFACFPAGISRMPFGRFFVAALMGSTIWCVVMLNIGLALGRRWGLALRLIRHYTVFTVGVLVLMVIVYFVVTSGVRRYLAARVDTMPDSVDGGDEGLGEEERSGRAVRH